MKKGIIIREVYAASITFREHIQGIRKKVPH